MFNVPSNNTEKPSPRVAKGPENVQDEVSAKQGGDQMQVN